MRTPSATDHGFAPTLPPPLADDEALALALGPMGAETVTASVIDIDEMVCESCWHIAEHGGGARPLRPRSLDDGYSTAIATIVRLNRSPAESVIARRLGERRWVFAWRIDEYHIAIAEANYRVARDSQTVADGDLMRLICESGIRAGRLAVAFEQDDAGAVVIDGVRTSTMPDSLSLPRPPWRDDMPPAMAATVGGAPGGVQAPDTGAAFPRYAFAVAALLAVYIAVAGAVVAVQQHGREIHEAALAGRDAVLAEQLAPTLDGGDYGELQEEIDALVRQQALDAVAVTNTRGQIVAFTGEFVGARIGDRVDPAMPQAARPVDIVEPRGVAQGGQRIGQLWIVDAPPVDPPLFAGWLTALTGLALCATLTVLVWPSLRALRPNDRRPSRGPRGPRWLRRLRNGAAP